MSAVLASRSGGALRFDPRIAFGLVLASFVAWTQPGDRLFTALTFGQPWLRVIAIVAIGLAGLEIGKAVDLGVEHRTHKRFLWASTLCAAAVAVVCAVSDWAFRSTLQPSYLWLLHAVPMAERTPIFMLRAVNESIVYRLFLGSLFVWVVGKVWRTKDGRPAAGAYWTGFALAQGLNVWLNVTSRAPLTPPAVLHDALRYFLPGMVWGWLFWRRGFQANEVACAGAHLLFQPLVGLGV